MEEKKIMIPKPLGDIVSNKNNNLDSEYMQEDKEREERRKLAEKLAKENNHPKDMKFRRDLERKKRRR